MKNYRILVIDDEADFTLLLKNYLTRLGHTVSTAGTITQGLEEAEAFKPEVIFLDNHLPDGLGWQQVPLLKEKYPDTTINLMSAYYTHLAHLKEYPDVQFIEKPLGLKAISNLLANPANA
ncbi:Response regulator receiver domain-containing protein [Filimonas lacunae]|uniref:Response regulator receiver domain-containing protein n=1 Tax=Filimonas lacunae TaxID=477680 RepID=A0A173MEN9_9BACT|nr:response regulator [Filimonas lacunae]BAV06054.1 response regulator receiver [Filimonas lacunae]SIT24435.1 Response regulator receiver domain-containing protein [Filimonas lacunae]